MGPLLIYDFDGVIADSEVVANTVLAEMVTELGLPTSLQDAYRLYMGKRFSEVMSAVQGSLGRTLPPTFAADCQARTLGRFRQELRLVDGVRRYLDVFAHLPRCIASSSQPDRLAVCLEVLGLHGAFGANVFSASIVARGKPHPDIFLYAAQQMGVPPARSVVLEDGPSGVAAALAAGMAVIGILAASHIQGGQRERLHSAGARHVAQSFEEAEAITRRLLAAMQ